MCLWARTIAHKQQESIFIAKVKSRCVRWFVVVISVSRFPWRRPENEGCAFFLYPPSPTFSPLLRPLLGYHSYWGAMNGVHSLRSMAVLSSRAHERPSREIRARSARERAYSRPYLLAVSLPSRVYYLARPTKTAMRRRLWCSQRLSYLRLSYLWCAAECRCSSRGFYAFFTETKVR